jgi:hypothetical protein
MRAPLSSASIAEISTASVVRMSSRMVSPAAVLAPMTARREAMAQL